MKRIILLLSLLGAASAQTLQVIHNFKPYSTDGWQSWASLVFDSSGDLYGTTRLGGAHDPKGCEKVSCGTVFKLSLNAKGVWVRTIVHSFGGPGDVGIWPETGVTLDAAGNIYGTTLFGGPEGGGTGFELSPKPKGGWTVTILRGFSSIDRSYSGLIFDQAGNLYGTTSSTVFELSSGSGGWTNTVLYQFSGEPHITAGLVLDTAGNLYGTTSEGGTCGCGTVFEVSPGANNQWTETTLYNFKGGSDGSAPIGGLTLDSEGNLYGTTSVGYPGGGTIFELSLGSSGWTKTILYSFKRGVGDGDGPRAALVFDAVGNLYGTTGEGGTYNYGTVFEMSSEGIETILRSFNVKDGEGPAAGLVLDSGGNLYGTTVGGGLYNGGNAFKLKP